MSGCCKSKDKGAETSCCGASGASAETKTEFSAADVVQQYYGEALTKSSDLKSDACCTDETLTPQVKKALANVHDECHLRYYGCGLVYPGDDLKGKSILDLGCGAGRDVYVLSQLVGEQGSVIGVDFTENMLSVAQRHVDFHAKKFGYAKPNTKFVLSDIAKLPRENIPDESIDVIVSNCVINLCKDKNAVLEQAFRVLKHGGELYFSDVYSDRRVPVEVAQDPVLYGECLGGALYWNDFLRLAKSAGFADPRLVTHRELLLDSKSQAIRDRCGGIRFFSATYRLWKVQGLESSCEDYGQAVRYKGTLPSCPHEYILDSHHTFEKGRLVLVCSNTFNMIKYTRLAPHFELVGDASTHFGIFPDCGTSMPFKPAGPGAAGGAGTCSSGACC